MNRFKLVKTILMNAPVSLIMVPGNETGKYTKDREHGKMGIEERRSNHATQCVHTGVQSKDRHRGA